MKLFKKVLAAALAGVLALSVLTGCGNGSGSGTVDYTSQVVGALQNYFDTNGEYDDVEIKIIEGNTAMKTQLKQLVSKVLDSDVSFEGVTEEKEVFQAILKNQELTAEIAGMSRPLFWTTRRSRCTVLGWFRLFSQSTRTT